MPIQAIYFNLPAKIKMSIVYVQWKLSLIMCTVRTMTIDKLIVIDNNLFGEIEIGNLHFIFCFLKWKIFKNILKNF